MRAAEAKGLRFTYRTAHRPALDGVDLGIDKGELVAIVGPSGAGKSTLCLCLNGLIPHFVRGSFEGEVRIFGDRAADATVARLARQVGLVFQDFEAQLFSTNVQLEVAFGLENIAVPLPDMRRRVAAALATVGLVGLERREPATLSGGQKQRLAIASVLALEPPMLLLDEATSDLDPVGKRSVIALARRLREQGVTLVVVEHDAEEILDVDRVVVMDSGKIATSGSAGEILTRTAMLAERGVQPPGAAALLVALGEEPTLSDDDAIRVLRRRGYRVPDDRWRSLEAVDASARDRGGEAIVEVRSLTHRYAGGVYALNGVDLTIRRGEFVAVVGQNGSGKTTLVKHFNGLLHPTSGEVRIEGKLTTRSNVNELGRRVGYVFQNPDHQIFAESVHEEVAFGPRNHGVPEEEVERRVAQSLAAVGLAGREQDDPFTMTKGERQRVAVASVLATRPQVIVLDEPTTGLDFREQRRMMELVRRLNEEGHTIVCVTHSMPVVAEYARRVIVVRDGRIVADGPTREVFSREDDLAAASLRAPQVVRVTRALGRTLLSVREASEALSRA